MTELLAAFSLQAKIEQYGAYAGIAAVFGLGVLSLLYFAQAREVKRLREWAGRAPERAAELEARVSAEAQKRVAAQPAGAASAATPAGAMAAATPGAAGAARPPVAAGATERRLPATAGIVSAAGAVAVGSSTGPSAPVVAPAAAAAMGNGAGAGTAVPPPGAPAPAPVRPAPQPNGGPARAAPASSGARPAIPAPAAAGAAAAGAAARPQPPRASAPARASSPSAAPPRTPAGAKPRGADGGSPGRLAAIVGAIVGLLAVAAVAVIVLSSGGDGNDTPAPAPNTVASPSANGGVGGGQPARRAAPKVDRGAFTVAVLNGTTVTGVARGASDKVTGRGYKQGVVTNDPTNQARRATQIFFAARARPAALDIARILGVPTASVKAMDPSARLAADGAQVAVFIGADKAQ
jgi:LytR cell envelope-related transcriptional attenuator